MTAAVALAVAGVVLLVLAVATARRPATLLDRDGYLDRWSELHGGYDPRSAGGFVRGWLTVVHAVARPVARAGLQPDVITLGSLWLALAVVVVAGAGGAWPVAAASLLAASGLLDSVDGCVAVLQDRVTKWGYVLDSLVDRGSDVLYLVALVQVGAPVELAAAVGFGVLLLEYARARSGNAGGGEIGTVTVAERPTRVLVPAAALLGAGLVTDRADDAATVGAAVLGLLTLVGLGQLLVAVRRELVG